MRCWLAKLEVAGLGPECYLRCKDFGNICVFTQMKVFVVEKLCLCISNSEACLNTSYPLNMFALRTFTNTKHKCLLYMALRKDKILASKSYVMLLVAIYTYISTAMSA